MADQRFPTAEGRLTLEAVMVAAAFRISSQQPTMVSHGVGGLLQLHGMVASMMTSGLQVPNNHYSRPQQGGSDDDDIQIDIDDSSPMEVLADDTLDVPITVSPVHLTTTLWILALITLIFVIGTSLYQPAMGVVFSSNKVGYYHNLAAIFTSGVTEAFIAFWLSRSRNTNRHRFSFRRAALCFSIGPFVAIVGISGFTFIES